MIGILLNILLAVVWALFSGEMSLRELSIGFLIGFALLRIFPDALGSGPYVRMSLGLLRFIWFFIRELTVANVQMAIMALRPHPQLNAMIFSVPIRLRTPLGQTLMVAVVTLMPGSVVMGFNPERTTLYIHAIGLENLRAARESVTKVEDALLQFLPTPSELKEARS